IPPQSGKYSQINQGKGNDICKNDTNQFIANVYVKPLIKDKTIEDDNALCLNSFCLTTGHVKSKVNVIIGGNIES
ncbi:FapA family protein, partial [Vibrio parahaemolyticus]|nr:FapA family protein [Vibrio parahaemolyticus]